MENKSSGAPSIPVLVVTTAKPGGAERALTHLVARLPRFGFEPTLLLLEPGPLQQWLAQAGCDRVLTATSPDHAHHLAGDAITRTGTQLVLCSKPEAHVVGGAAAQQAGIPAVWWQRDTARRTPTQMAAAAQPTAAVVCPSSFSVAAQRRLTPSVDVVRIPPGVPVEALGAMGARASDDRELRHRARPPLVGIVGRLQHFKAQHVFLKAAALVARRRRDVRFVVIGGAVVGNERDYPVWLRKLAWQQGIADRVHFAGHQADIVPWLNALDVVVHTTHGEPFGLVLVEAMAMGTPVIAASAGGPAEIIEDRESGRLVPPGRPQATADAILELLEDSDLSARLSAAGRDRASSFGIERMAGSFASLFATVLGTEPPGVRVE
jgi:glycosyltransferase involved in cell wall biosynthesis